MWAQEGRANKHKGMEICFLFGARSWEQHPDIESRTEALLEAFPFVFFVRAAPREPCPDAESRTDTLQEVFLIN